MSDILSPDSKPAGPVEAEVRQSVNKQFTSPPFSQASDHGAFSDYAAMVTTHYAELAAFVRDVLSGR